MCAKIKDLFEKAELISLDNEFFVEDQKGAWAKVQDIKFEGSSITLKLENDYQIIKLKEQDK